MTLQAVTAGSEVGNRTVEFVVMAATAAASRMVAGGLWRCGTATAIDGRR
jgi:hypothetical protein